jgi:hypothetical protein
LKKEVFDVMVESKYRREKAVNWFDDWVDYRGDDPKGLLVMDNAEDLMKEDGDNFVEVLEKLMSPKNLKVLLTSRTPIGDFDHNSKHQGDVECIQLNVLSSLVIWWRR